MQIEGKVFIVTGGASGLGEGTARMLAEHGGKVGAAAPVLAAPVGARAAKTPSPPLTAATRRCVPKR